MCKNQKTIYINMCIHIYVYMYYTQNLYEESKYILYIQTCIQRIQPENRYILITLRKNKKVLHQEFHVPWQVATDRTAPALSRAMATLVSHGAPEPSCCCRRHRREGRWSQERLDGTCQAIMTINWWLPMVGSWLMVVDDSLSLYNK